ncbi:MAG: hypothetical protein KAI47_27185, partial [Deltaproteobacteria bacterium]|nr:hypothetical protein [Deltaproteobacteria bacterium]
MTPRATATLPPLPVEEIQRNVSGAVRLSRTCLDRPAPSGLYIVRLFIAPSGQVTSATPRHAPRRADDPGSYLGVPRYLDAGTEPMNEVTRCFASALAKLHFHPF